MRPDYTGLTGSGGPKWRNWQTRRTQNPVPLGECGFDSHLRHLTVTRFPALREDEHGREGNAEGDRREISTGETKFREIALADAKRRGLFKRQTAVRVPHPRTSPRGRLTDAGWAALGPVPGAWAEAFGPRWWVVTGDLEVRPAFDLIAAELRREALPD